MIREDAILRICFDEFCEELMISAGGCYACPYNKVRDNCFESYRRDKFEELNRMNPPEFINENCRKARTEYDGDKLSCKGLQDRKTWLLSEKCRECEFWEFYELNHRRRTR